MAIYSQLLCIFATIVLTLGWDFNGYGTYYGGIGGVYGPGTCHQTYIPPGHWGVALTYAQYGDGWVCGSCLSGCIYYKGGGSKCFKGIIDNKCGTCEKNGLDFGVDGDGRYDIGWSFVPCPVRDPIFSTGENTSRYWAQIKVEGAGPQNYLFVNDKAAIRANGGWSFNDGAGMLGCGPKIKVGLADGRVITKCMDGGLFGGGYCPDTSKRCYMRYLDGVEPGSEELISMETEEEHRELEKIHSYYVNEYAPDLMSQLTLADHNIEATVDEISNEIFI